MATKHPPLPCIACHQPLPPQVERISYFAQGPLLPTADDREELQQEVRDIIGYIGALFQLLVECPKAALDNALLSTCFELGDNLAEEAQRHLALVQEAWEREEQHHAGAAEGRGN
jgi:hypothetical protein